MPSSSSSKTVRRYISVVSIRSFTARVPLLGARDPTRAALSDPTPPSPDRRRAALLCSMAASQARPTVLDGGLTRSAARAGALSDPTPPSPDRRRAALPCSTAASQARPTVLDGGLASSADG